MEIVEEIGSDDDQDWQEAERFWIAMFRFWGCRLNNHHSGGQAGFRMSEITKRKISIANKGRPRTKEWIGKMVATKKATITTEMRAAMSARMRGKNSLLRP